MSLYLGSIYPKSLYDELVRRKQFVDYPANVFQSSLLKGLDDQYTGLRVISSPVIKSKYSDVKDICNKHFFSHNGATPATDIYVGTLAIPGLQMLYELVKVYKALKKELRKSTEKENVFVYALHSPFLLAAALLKKHTRCICVVIPDLPEFMTGKGSVFRKIGKRVDRAIINSCLKRLDCVVLLSEYMREKLPIKNKPWVLMEGVYDSTYVPEKLDRKEEKIIFYGGSLSKSYGILELLDAFCQIENRNYRLWICGDGDGREEVINRASQDNRIQYFGVVSHKEVLSLLQRATVLINPRNSSGEYTKYSFPSKTMEYMASGTPTIMCHLPAIPKEYDNYLYYIVDEDAEGIKNKLMEVCELSQDELDAMGKNASEFILKNKNVFTQTSKVADMIRQFNRG